jgi:hypothetical protein
MSAAAQASNLNVSHPMFGGPDLKSDGLQMEVFQLIDSKILNLLFDLSANENHSDGLVGC